MNVITNSRRLVLATFLSVASLAVLSTAYGCEIELTSSPQATTKPALNIGCSGGGGGTVNYSQDYSWGNTVGSANTATKLSNGAISSSGITIPSQVDNVNYVFTSTLPHSQIQMTMINNNGSYEYKFYVYTKSAYAPNGDSGTMIIDSSGNFIEGSAEEWTRLAQEVEDADPNQVAQARGIFGTIGGWISNHATQLSACSNLTAFAAINVAAFALGPEGMVAAGMFDLSMESNVAQMGDECF